MPLPDTGVDSCLKLTLEAIEEFLSCLIVPHKLWLKNLIGSENIEEASRAEVSELHHVVAIHCKLADQLLLELGCE